MLALQFIPYSEVEGLSSVKRIKKLLDLVKADKIILLEGRLKKSEEKDLIEITMEEIDDRFKGIELAVIYPESKGQFVDRMKKGFLSLLLGNRLGFTIIGPATLIKEIKRDPDKIMLYTSEESLKKSKNKRGKR